jgi:hypothetical protein
VGLGRASQQGLVLLVVYLEGLGQEENHHLGRQLHLGLRKRKHKHKRQLQQQTLWEEWDKHNEQLCRSGVQACRG